MIYPVSWQRKLAKLSGLIVAPSKPGKVFVNTAVVQYVLCVFIFSPRIVN